ncbi:MAG: hypothetical protein KBE65_12380 [Phycisphaerae bacterium]|nr:hypothetical protein [Phycisphaerae bacterium]
MKRSVFVCLVLASLFSGSALAGEWEFTGAMNNFFPSDDVWEGYAIGGEVRGAYWLTPQWGVGLAGGLTNWDADDNTEVISRNEELGTQVSLTSGGDVTYLPFGISAMARFGTTAKNRLNGYAEVGLRYMFSDSDMQVKRTATFASDDPIVECHEIDCDDGIVARIGGGVEWALNDADHPVKLVLVGGYQFDLDKGDATEDQWDIDEELSLEAFYIDLGLVVPIH